jgi:DNA-binding winged helix-turn-helix (wHTH) protein
MRGMSDRSLSFGPFELFPQRRALLESGKPLRLGSRALEVLIVLVEHAGELLSNKDLLTLNQRVPGSSPGAPTKQINSLAMFTV